MYHYSAYKVSDISILRTAIADYPLGLVVSLNRQLFMTTHIPLLLKGEKVSDLKLIGHMDNNNPQLDGMNGAEVLVVFSGPDSYISPRDYATAQLPTWNYIRVHARGTATICVPGDEILDDIDELVAHVETSERPWQIDRGNPRVHQLAPLISRIEITVTELEGRFKLSQEKCEDDRRAALHRLLSGLSEKQRVGVRAAALRGL